MPASSVSVALESSVAQVIAEIACVDETEITAGAKLCDDLQFDSLDLADLAMRLEESLLGGDPVVTDDLAAEWVTVADVFRTVEKLQQPQARRRA